jgi:hypothetical protein
MTIEIEDEFLVYLQAALYMIHSSLEGAEVGGKVQTKTYLHRIIL